MIYPPPALASRRVSGDAASAILAARIVCSQVSGKPPIATFPTQTGTASRGRPQLGLDVTGTTGTTGRVRAFGRLWQPLRSSPNGGNATGQANWRSLAGYFGLNAASEHQRATGAGEVDTSGRLQSRCGVFPRIAIGKRPGQPPRFRLQPDSPVKRRPALDGGLPVSPRTAAIGRSL